MIQISLPCGSLALVDDDDADLVLDKSWHAYHKSNTSYVCTTIAGQTVYLHRLLLSPPDGLQVDHIDGDGLNNRRSNLRLATGSQNVAAQRRIPAHGYRGVCKRGEKWRAEIGWGSRRTRGPTRSTKIEAARDYDRIALQKYGEFAQLNFPAEGGQ